MALTYQGATSASATTVTLPTHAVGDLIVIMADGSAVPTMPSAGGTVPTWTSIATDGTNYNRLAYAVASATNHTSGTWTNANAMLAVVMRGQKSSGFIGGNALNYQTWTTSPSASSITLSDSGGSSAIIHLYKSFGSTFPSSNWNAAPSGYTAQYTVNAPYLREGFRVITKDTTTSDGAAVNSLSAAAHVYSASLEILAAPSNTGQFFPFFT